MNESQTKTSRNRVAMKVAANDRITAIDKLLDAITAACALDEHR